jgi:hypothetical protein
LNALQKIESGRNGKALRTTPASYTISAVVHIIHNVGPENIPNADVLTAGQSGKRKYFVQWTQDSKVIAMKKILITNKSQLCELIFI